MAQLELQDALDLVTAFDTIHDQAHPAQVLSVAARAVRPGGVFLMVDITGSSEVDDNLDLPLATFLYTASTLHCMPVSLGLGGVGLGTMWGRQTALRMLGEAGFAEVEVHEIDSDPQNVYYVCTLGRRAWGLQVPAPVRGPTVCLMLAAYAAAINPDDPLAGLVVGERPEPPASPGWVVLPVVAAGLNHHDLWSLRGVGLPADRLPMILGCDAVCTHPELGEVVILPVVAGTPGWPGDITLDPRRSLLSEVHQGTLAEQVAVPDGHWVPKPEHLSALEAAPLSTAWLTAYRMLFRNAGVQPGDTVLVQGAGGGVATALIQLGVAAGLRVWVTSRDERKANNALALGAEQAFGSGERVPERVDAVLESVGAATWTHSVNSLRPGGTIVICGATSGDAPPKAELTKIFFRQLRVVGSTMGTLTELQQLCRFVGNTGLRPQIDSSFTLAQTGEGLRRMAAGDITGKIGIEVRSLGAL